MEFKTSELADKKNHYTDLKECIINSLNRVNPIAWYVEGNEKIMFFNGRMWTITHPDKTRTPFKKPL